MLKKPNMDPRGYELIRKWLEETGDQGFSREITPPRVNENGDRGNNPASPPPSPFATLVGQHALERLQNRDKPAQSDVILGYRETSPLGPAKKRKERSYERRPRRRTKEDRYEYRLTAPRMERERRPNESRVSKQNRKHTINANFHAPNVPAGRLTLNPRMNMGLFNKGRTSSPVRSRELPDLTFSEMNFLSRRPQNHGEPSTDQRDKGKAPARNEHGLQMQMQIPQYFSNDYPEGPSQEQAPVVGIDNTQEQIERLPQTPNDAGQPQSSSTTPYTWSKSSYGQDHQAPENCTKGILCADLTHQHLSEEGKENKRYWDLWELKLILKIRQDRQKQAEESRQRSLESTEEGYRQLPGETEEIHTPKERKLFLERHAGPSFADLIHGHNGDFAQTQRSWSSSSSSKTERGEGNPPSLPAHPQSFPSIPEHLSETNPNLLNRGRHVSGGPSYRHPSPPARSPRRSNVSTVDQNGPSQWTSIPSPFQWVNKGYLGLGAQHDNGNGMDLEMEIVNYFLHPHPGEKMFYDKDNNGVIKDFDKVYESIIHSDITGPTDSPNQLSNNQNGFLPAEDHQSPFPFAPRMELQYPFIAPGLAGQNAGSGANVFHYNHWPMQGEQVTNGPFLNAQSGHSFFTARSFGVGSTQLGDIGFSFPQNKLY